ncbi:MAG: 2-dehydro-3-deoxy-D-gluconate 5-dehydrogenase KduD [Rhizobiaceae bacterium]|nr:2-dehydro-3-deoxy-D-gluconate 5-dehydrogenase KduD [Rhizobiaceae bacterium]
MTDLSAFSLEGKRIAVTGANTGIGQGIALAVARAGGAVVGIGRSSMAETAKQVEALGMPFQGVKCDIGNMKASVLMLDKIMADAPLDGLVNNAGIIRRGAALDFSEEDWDDVMDVNLKSLFFLCQTYAKNVLASGRSGRIVNIASMLSFQGGIRVASYTVAKHGVLGVTRLLANEWASSGINVNAIAPGYIETNNTEVLRKDPDRSEAILARIPAGRWGKPGEIGDAAVFLLAPASTYMHGAVVPVDGGWLAR